VPYRAEWYAENTPSTPDRTQVRRLPEPAASVVRPNGRGVWLHVPGLTGLAGRTSELMLSSG
jgi:hypothetical protein